MVSPFSPLIPALVLMAVLVSSLPVIVPGTWIAERVLRRTWLPESLFPLFVIATGTLIGYAAFWCYFVGPVFGKFFSTCVMLGSIAVLVIPAERRRLMRALAPADVSIPLSGVLAVAFVYLVFHLGLLPDPLPEKWSWTAHARVSGMLVTVENFFPLHYAGLLYDAEPLLGSGSSDRPPLQSGLVLVQLPLWRALDTAFASNGITDACYQALGTLLQCSWVAAVYALLRLLGIPRRNVMLAILGLIPTYFFYIQSVFVWPKLLAGSLTIGVFCLLLVGRRPGEALSRPHMLFAAGFAALGFLAHGGVATSLLGFSLVLLLPRWFPGWRNVAAGAVLFALTLAPWTAYQTFVDPPGNYLVKNHLAGVITRDDRTTAEAIYEEYSQLTPTGWASSKWIDIRTVLGLEGGELRHATPYLVFRALRNMQSRYVFPALGLLNLGWLLIGVGTAAGPLEGRRMHRNLAQVLAVALLCLITWILLFLSAPIVQHASYATLQLFFAGLAGAIALAPRAVAVPVLATNAVVSMTAAFGFSPHQQYVPINVLAAALGYTLLVAGAIHSLRRLGDSAASTAADRG